MQLPSSVRAVFKIYLTSKEADQSVVITTSEYKLLENRLVKNFLKEHALGWIRIMNTEHGVNDFKLMPEKEVEAFISGTHRHNQGDDNENPNLRH
jgi:hypothetical protein